MDGGHIKFYNESRRVIHALIKGSKLRKADHPIDNLFLDRWSLRAISEEDLPEAELMLLFEASRWVPSSNNN
jgi:hypothetical protein